MKNKWRRRSNVPAPLRRAFGDRVRTLESVILSLLPTPPSASPVECRCCGRLCLGCMGSSHLRRDDDPPEYRRLLARGFCFLALHAPPPPRVYHSPNSSMDKIIKRAIELIPNNGQLTNVLLKNYKNVLARLMLHKTCCSRDSKSFCFSTWELLLSRTGNPLMIFLLQFSSIFIPMPNKNHYQLTGPPLDIVLKSLGSFDTASRKEQPYGFVNMDSKLKRKVATRDIVVPSSSKNEWTVPMPSCDAKSATSDCSSTKKSRRRGRLFSWQRKKFKKAKFIDCDLFAQDSKESSVTNFQFTPDTNTEGQQCEPVKSDTLDVAAEASLLNGERFIGMVQPTLSKLKRKVATRDIVVPSSSKNEWTVPMPSCDAKSATSDCSSTKKSRRRGRLFSWQRKKFKKAKFIDCDLFAQDGKESSVTNFQFTPDTNTEGQQCEPVKSDMLDVTTEASLLNGERFIGMVQPTLSEVYNVLIDDSSDSLLSEKTDSGQIILLPESHHLKPGCASTVESGEASHHLFTNFKVQHDLGGPENQHNLQNQLEKVQNISFCFCCKMIHFFGKIPIGAQIQRSRMLHNRFSYSSVLPREHILNSIKPNYSGAIVLMEHIFGLPHGWTNFQVHANSSCHCTKARPCLCHLILRLLKSLIRNASRCQYRKLLHKHCMILKQKHDGADRLESGVVERDTRNMLKELDSGSTYAPRIMFSGNDSQIHQKHKENSNNAPVLECIESYSRHHQVVSFIWAVCRSIIPVDLLGDCSAWRILQRNISKFIRLNRFDKYHLKHCIYGLKNSSFPFLSKLKSSDCFCEDEVAIDDGADKRIRLEVEKSKDAKRMMIDVVFRRWMYWLFSDVVVPLISANFYVTERESRKHDLFYYPKPIWRKLVQRTITCLDKNFQQLSSAHAECILTKHSLGFSKVRFLPKETCLRPLANLKASSQIRIPNNVNGPVRRCRSVNSALHDLYAILRHAKSDNPEFLGSSVFDYNDVYHKLHHFTNRMKSKLTVIPEIFMVVADVSKAFDSINQDKLIGIMRNIVEKDVYVIREYKQILRTRNSLKFLSKKKYDVNDSAINFKTSICGSSILIDQGINKHVSKVEFYKILYKHLKHNILQYGRKFYLQKVGISQGSSLSCLLCSFYFGHLERTVLLPYLQKVNNRHNTSADNNNVIELCDSDGDDVYKSDSWSTTLPDHLLFRYIDDFLFISTSKEQALCFYNRIRRGFTDYNCRMNENKFGLNFDAKQNRHLPDRMYISEDGTSFIPWSGLLLNSHTLEIQADYTRYTCVHMSSTITVQAHAKPGRYLKNKLCDLVRIKCHPIFYDSNINSPPIVRLNAYQLFLLCAMKFYCLVRSRREFVKLRPIYLLQIIEQSFRYMHKHLKKLVRDMVHRFRIHPVLGLQKEEIIWLGLYAYIRVLRKKQSRYTELLSLLRSRIATFEMIGDASELKYAVDDSHSSVFWKLKF